MSKKIIYLFSLLMVLSLLFASCKKDGNKGITGTGSGGENQEEEIKTASDSLYQDWDSIKDLTIIQNFPVIDESKSGSDYYRNPIIVALNGEFIAIIAEKRISFKGSENDIGVNGEKAVEIISIGSLSCGHTWTISLAPVGYKYGTGPTGGDDALSSPVVYYQKPSAGTTAAKMYIIASSGAGLSRTDTAYSNRKLQSKLKYTVGDVILGHSGYSITWSDWKDLVINDSSLLTTQFGTHSGRGIFTSAGNLVLPIITADLGVNNDIKDAMGVMFFEVQITGDKKDTLTVGNKIGTAIEFAKDSIGKFSMYKEVEAVSYDGSKVTYLAVPNPSRNNYTMGKGDSSSPSVTALTGLKGSEGSFGFLRIDNGWYGAQEYNPATYSTNTSTAGTTVSTAILFSHVVSKVGISYLYMLNDTTYTPKRGKLQIAKTSKSSSIDILPDGTIIMASEKEKNPNASGNKFNIFFSRYTQKYIAENMK